jgi:hypothetical protein
VTTLHPTRQRFPRRERFYAGLKTGFGEVEFPWLQPGVISETAELSRQIGSLVDATTAKMANAISHPIWPILGGRNIRP